jgi:ribosomal protein S18 acetylase RimI-like enzyme
MRKGAVDFEIKRLPASRWRDYKRLRLEALRSNPFAFGRAYVEEKGLPESEWRRLIRNDLFAVSDGKPIGMIGYVFNEKLKRSHIADIVGVYVNGKYRGMGIGDRLFKEVLSQIRRNKRIVKIRLNVNPRQKAAVGLYKKNGFVEVGRLRKELKIGNRFFDDLIMEKLL